MADDPAMLLAGTNAQYPAILCQVTNLEGDWPTHINMSWVLLTRHSSPCRTAANTIPSNRPHSFHHENFIDASFTHLTLRSSHEWGGLTEKTSQFHGCFRLTYHLRILASYMDSIHTGMFTSNVYIDCTCAVWLFAFRYFKYFEFFMQLQYDLQTKFLNKAKKQPMLFPVFVHFLYFK